MTEPDTPSGTEQVRALYEQAESRAADAFEELVSKPSFGVLLARSAENVAAISRLSSDLADLVLRNLRVAGRADVTRLARQLQRTEDKLERLLQEVEELRDELARALSASRSGVAETNTLPKPTREAANTARAGIGTLPKPTREAANASPAGTDALPKPTREAANAAPAGTDALPKPTRGPSAVRSHGAEPDTEPKRTRGAS
jgi:ABC-type transporter Mla subunit MlaD